MVGAGGARSRRQRPSGSAWRVAVDVVEHVPVLAEEVVAALVHGPGWYLDATVGGGGHAARLLASLPAEARLLGLDRDPAALSRAHDRLASYGDRVRLVHAPFDQL